MSRARLLLSVPLALLACGGAPGGSDSDSDVGSTGADNGTTTTGGPDTTTSSTSTSGTPTTTGDPPSTTTGAQDGPTYWRDVKQIIDANCATCHRPGDIAPFSLTNYAEASTFADILAPAVDDRSMPPWPPSGECNDYAHDRSLTDDERATVLAWVDAGAPEGDPNDAPPPVDPGGDTIDYDVEIGIPEPFTPAAVEDDYRCFLLDWPKDQPTYATAFTIEPGAREIVHHVIAFIIPPDETDQFVALDEADPGPGYPCYGGPGGEASPRAQWLGAWVPGASEGALPQDTGILVQPGSKIAMQMHYHPTGEPLADQSSLKVRTADSVARPAYLLPMANPGWMIDSPEMTIPAGDPDVVHSFSIDLNSIIWYLYGPDAHGIGLPLQAHMAGVHMHTRGVRASVIVERDGAEASCLVDVPRWDFGWQGVYELAAPFTVDPGDTLRLECHFDNSAGDAPLKWGEGTGDEMCLGMIYVSAPAD
jgi:hypothetical protein